MVSETGRRIAAFEKDVLSRWEAAKILLDSHGPLAESLASERVEETLRIGDRMANEMWRAILAAIVELSKVRRAGIDPLH